MTEASAKTNNAIGRWFAARLETRIDRLWIGGVLGVSVLVTALLDFRFVAIFLIGYFFIFVLRNREKIQSVFPPTGNIAYGYANEITNPHVSLAEKKKSYWKFHWFMFPIFWGFILVYPFFPSGSVYFSGRVYPH